MTFTFRHSAGFGKRSIWFNGCKKDKNGDKQEYAKPQFDNYLAVDFSRFK